MYTTSGEYWNSNVGKELLKDPKWNVFNLFNNGILKTKPSSTGLTIVQHA